MRRLFNEIKNVFKSKKLLVLGGNYETIPLVEIAKKLGYCVVVTDNVIDSPAKSFADFALNIDAKDVPEIVDYCLSNQISGVVVGVADQLLVSYAKVCDELGFPSYGNENQMKCLSNKYEFNELLERFGLKPIPYDLINQVSDDDIGLFEFPVLIKPVDSSAGKGISIVKNANTLQSAVEYARNYSESKLILIEKYMACPSIGIYITIQDGQFFMSAIFDRYTKNFKNKGIVSTSVFYPSDFAEMYMDKVHLKLVDALSSLNLQNGVLLVCAFVEKGDFFLFDPGFRLQGEGADFYVKYFSGFDQKEAFINLALTNSFTSGKVQLTENWKFGGKFAVTVWILLHAGQISEINGLTELNSNDTIVAIEQRLKIGDTVTEEFIGTERQVFARIRLCSRSKPELIKTIKFINLTLKIFDSNKKKLNIVVDIQF